MIRKPKIRGQFVLRDLLYVTLVVAIGLGWFLDRQAHLRREKALLKKVAASNARSEEFIAAQAELLDAANESLKAFRAANSRLEQELSGAHLCLE